MSFVGKAICFIMFAKTLRVFGVGGVMFLIRSPFTHTPNFARGNGQCRSTQAHATLEDTDRSQCPVQCGRVLGVLDFGDRTAMETMFFF